MALMPRATVMTAFRAAPAGFTVFGSLGRWWEISEGVFVCSTNVNWLPHRATVLFCCWWLWLSSWATVALLECTLLAELFVLSGLPTCTTCRWILYPISNNCARHSIVLHVTSTLRDCSNEKGSHHNLGLFLLQPVQMSTHFVGSLRSSLVEIQARHLLADVLSAGKMDTKMCHLLLCWDLHTSRDSANNRNASMAKPLVVYSFLGIDNSPSTEASSVMQPSRCPIILWLCILWLH